MRKVKSVIACVCTHVHACVHMFPAQWLCKSPEGLCVSIPQRRLFAGGYSSWFSWLMFCWIHSEAADSVHIKTNLGTEAFAKIPT